MQLVTLATIRNSHGLKGELKCVSQTSFPKERFQKGKRMFLYNAKDNSSREVTVSLLKGSGDDLIVGFEEIKTIEEAKALIGYEIRIPLEEAPLPDNHYRISELINCKVISTDGEELGEVIDCQSFSTTFNLKIKNEFDEIFYVPFIDDFVSKVDLVNKKIVINVVEGMLP